MKNTRRARVSDTNKSTVHRATSILEVGSGDGVASDDDNSRVNAEGTISDLGRSTSHEATAVVEFGNVDRVVHSDDRNRLDVIGSELTQDQLDEVNEELYGVGNANDEIVVLGVDSVQRYAFQTLRPDIWLNDEVIHAYFVLLQKRENSRACRTDRSHFFKSFFLTKLFDEGATNSYKVQ